MKKGIKLFFLASTFSFLLCSCYIKQESEQTKTITVNGTGTVTAEPDMATIDFTVVSSGWSAKQIVTDNDTLTKRLSDAVKNIGVNENDISVSDCTISNPSNQYEARRTVRVIVRNVSIVPAVIDCKSGAATRLKSFEYGLSDSSTLNRRARTAAIQQAQDAASLLAGASGSKISTVIDINEEKLSITPVSGGKINVTSQVKVTYSLQ